MKLDIQVLLARPFRCNRCHTFTKNKLCRGCRALLASNQDAYLNDTDVFLTGIYGPSDVELDSPSFTPATLGPFAARGHMRIKSKET